MADYDVGRIDVQHLRHVQSNHRPAALPSVMAEMSVDAATAQWLTTGFTLNQRHQ